MTIQDPDAQKNYWQAIQLANRQDFTRALLLFDKAITQNPNNAEYYSAKAIALISMGRDEEAIATTLKATALDPEMPEPWINRGVALGNLDRFEEAKKVLEYAVILAPDNPYARSNLARASAMADMPEKSRKQWIKTRDILYTQGSFWPTFTVISGFFLGLGFHVAGQLNSLFLEGAIIVMFFIICLNYLFRVKKAVGGFSDLEFGKSLYLLIHIVGILAFSGMAFVFGIIVLFPFIR